MLYHYFCDFDVILTLICTLMNRNGDVVLIESSQWIHRVACSVSIHHCVTWLDTSTSICAIAIIGSEHVYVSNGSCDSITSPFNVTRNAGSEDLVLPTPLGIDTTYLSDTGEK